MAITLQLSTAPQKAPPSSTSPASAGATPADPALESLPFAAIIEDLLKPADSAVASLPIVDEPSVIDLPAAPAPMAGNPSLDPATQALLASLAVLPQVPVTAALATDEAITMSAGQSAPGAAPGLSTKLPDELAQLKALPSIAAGPALPAFSGKSDQPAAEMLPVATPITAGDKRLPELVANLAAPVMNAKTRTTLSEPDVPDLLVSAAPMPDTAAPRAAPVLAPGLTTSTVSAAAHYVIPEPVASARWADALGQRALFMVDQQIKGAELHLNPPHLGPLEVKLALDGDKASLSFTTNQAAVREAVQQSLPRLHQVFADNGMAELNVQVHLGQQQQPQHQQARHFEQNAYGEGDNPGGAEEVRMQMQNTRWQSQTWASARGGVDTFA